MIEREAEQPPFFSYALSATLQKDKVNQMPSDSGTIIFYEQSFGGIAFLEARDNVSEETRVRVLPIGVYDLCFLQQPRYQLEGALLFNAENPDTKRNDQQKQFEIAEDIAGIERTLMIQTTGDAINLESVEVIPRDWRDNPIEFTQLAVSESERTIRYRKDPPVESLKLRFSGINVFDVESINGTLWANGRSYSQAELAAFIRRSEDIRIDRLDQAQGGGRKIEDHLMTFFRLLLEKAPDRIFALECSYRHQIAEGGPYALLPVLSPQRLNLATASELFSTLQPALQNWYQSFSPPKGVFDFGVKVYGTGSRPAVPVLHLSGNILPIESIAGWSVATN